MKANELTQAEIVKRSYADRASGCWFWTMHQLGGYGSFKVRQVLWLAHRASYTVFKGEIPADQVVMHLCDNRLCVNPDHLILGTQHENVLDAVRKGTHSCGWIGVGKKGNKHPFFGKRQTAEARKKISAASYRMWEARRAS